MAVDFVVVGEEPVSAAVTRKGIDFQPVAGGRRAIDFKPVGKARKAVDFVAVDSEGKTLADFAAAPDAAASEALLSQGPPPVVEGSLAKPQLPTEGEQVMEQRPVGDVPLAIGEQPATVPRVGAKGTLLRGASNVAGGIIEWALNKPEEAALTLTPAEPAILLRYGPEIAKHWGEQLKAGLKGDREALGEAITMAAMFLAPGALKAVKARGEREMVEGEAAVGVTAPAEVALTGTMPREGTGLRASVAGEKANVAEPAAVEAAKPAAEPAALTTGVDAAAVLPEAAKTAEALGVKVEATKAAEAKAGDAAAGEALPTTPPGGTEVSKGAGEAAVGGDVVRPVEPTAATVAKAADDLVPTRTATMNDMVDQQRAERGEPPIVREARKSDPELWAEAERLVDADAQLPERLAAELAERPRAMTDVENVVMDQHMVRLKNELDGELWRGIKAGDEAQAARDAARAAVDVAGREAARVAEADALGRAELAKAQSAAISERLDRVEEALGGAGTIMGRAFRARRLKMKEDFSYGGLVRRLRAAKDFAPLNAKELAQLRVDAEAFKKANEALEAKLEEQTRLAAKAQAQRELAELRAVEAKAQAAMGGRVKAIVGRVGATLDKRANEARARLRGKVLSLSPADLRDIGEIAAANLFHLGEDVARWTAKMVEELGEGVRPHLDELLKGARRALDETVKGEVAAAGAKGKRASTAKDEAAAKEAIAARLRKRIADYEDRIARGDYTTAKRPQVPVTKEIRDLQFELEKVKQRFHEGEVEARMARRTRPEKVFGGAVEGVNAMRAVLTAADLSAVLRQGGLVAMAHPLRAARSIVPMLKALASEKAAFAVEMQIRGRDNYPLYRASKLYLAEHGFSLSKMEEAYMSRLASKLPGIGRIVKGSERAYITFLNKLRADSFDAMKATLGRGGEITLPEARVISNFINVMTGRGTLSMREGAAANLSAVFFAPRFVASRFQALLGQPLYHGLLTGKAPIGGTKAVRGLVALEYGRMLTGAAVIIALGMAAGAEVELDPRSSDFLKLKFGNTRIDLLAGLVQNTVLLSKVVAGEKKNLRTGRIEALRGPKTGSEDVWAVLARYARFKLAPAPGLVVDFAVGKDAIGREISLEGQLGKALVPISFRDIYETMQEQDVPEGVAISLLSVFGASVQNFDATKRRREGH